MRKFVLFFFIYFYKFQAMRQANSGSDLKRTEFPLEAFSSPIIAA